MNTLQDPIPTPSPARDDGDHIPALGPLCDCSWCLCMREAARHPVTAALDRLDDLAGLNPQACGADADGSFGGIDSAPASYWLNRAHAHTDEPYESPLTVEAGTWPEPAQTEQAHDVADMLLHDSGLPKRFPKYEELHQDRWASMDPLERAMVDDGLLANPRDYSTLAPVHLGEFRGKVPQTPRNWRAWLVWAIGCTAFAVLLLVLVGCDCSTNRACRSMHAAPAVHS